MKTFKITDRVEVVCVSEKTRYGFRHLATLFVDGDEKETVKICYYNRTWEKYEFQSVLSAVINKTGSISCQEQELCHEYINGDHTDWSQIKAVSSLARMGDLLCETKKEKNDWKARMIKAGFEGKGLIMPSDWDTLSEDVKEKRLDLVINSMGERK